MVTFGSSEAFGHPGVDDAQASCVISPAAINQTMNSVAQLCRPAAELFQQRRSREFRTNLANAFYGAADYLVQPLGMVLAAPFLLHHLGTSQYGLWMLAMAVIAGTSFVSTGLGDATLRYVALCRGQANSVEVTRVIRTALTLNMFLGGTVALLLASASPFIVDHVFLINSTSRTDGIVVLRLGALILWLRSIELVLTNALRAYERYGLAVKVSTIARAAIILAAVASAALGLGTVGIMASTAAISFISIAALTTCARKTVAHVSFSPLLSKSCASGMFSFGGLLWLQALAGIAFSHADRLMIGGTLGTFALAQYSICVQGAQPIHGLLAAALHFLFPHLSARLAAASTRASRVLLPVLLANVAMTALLCLPVVLLSKTFLSHWMGAPFAESTGSVFAIASLGFGFLALNVTAHYALLALGQVRYVSCINIFAGAATLLAMWLLIPRYGIFGAALGRLVYGPLTWLMYYRLYTLLSVREECHPETISFQSISEGVE
jgi:O-antigen/teichoic acid export membrane protein